MLLEADASILPADDLLLIVRQLRDHLQTMLPTGRKLEQSGLLLELLGVCSTLYT